MKISRKLIGVLMALTVVINMFPVVSNAAVYRDAYSTIYANTLDGATASGYNAREKFLGSMTNGAGYYFEGVDFGTVPPKYVDVGIGVPDQYAGSKFQLILDSMDGEVIAEFVAESSGDFGTSVVRQYNITKKVTGTHTVYLKKVNGSPTNVYTLKFFAPLSADSVYQVYNGADEFVDISQSKQRNKINALAAFGILDSGDKDTNFYPKLYVSKIDFAQMVFKLLNKDWYDNTDARFSDMPDDSDKIRAVNYLLDEGFLQASGKKFNPAEFLSYDEGVEILCRAMGYGVLEDIYGKNAYSQVATDLKLNKGITSGGSLRNEDAAALIYNAAISNYYSYAFDEDNDVFMTESDKITLERTMGIKAGRGFLNATRYSSVVSPKSDVSGTEVMIDNQTYEIGSSAASQLLGYECDFFYSENGDEKTLVFIAPLDTVEITDIDGIGNKIRSISTSEVVYDNGKKEEKLKYENPVIFYNGVVTDAGLETFIDNYPLKGSVRLINNPHYNDVVFIEEYKNIVIDAIDYDEGIIVNKTDTSRLTINMDDDFVFCNRFGDNVRFKDLKAGDTAMVYTSKNSTGGKLIRFVVGGGLFEGRVGAVSSEYITVDQKQYPKASEFTGTISVADSIEFYVNANGEIVMFKFIAASDNIGLFVRSYIDEDNEKLYVRVYTTDNKLNSYECSEKIYIDGAYITNVQDAKTVLDSKSIDKTPVKFQMTKNKVKVLDTCEHGAGGTKDTLTKLTSSLKYQYESGNKVLVEKASGMVKSVFAPNGIWLSATGESGSIEDEYVWGSSPKYAADFTASLFTFDQTSSFADIVMFAEAEISYSSPFIFCESTALLDEKDEACYYIKGFSSAGEVTYKVKESQATSGDLAVVPHLKYGDWLRVTTDVNGYVNLIQICYANDGQTKRSYSVGGSTQTSNYLVSDNSYSLGSSNQDTRWTVGKVKEKFDDYLLIEHKDGKTEVISGSSVSCVKVTNENKEPTTGVDISSIKPGDDVAVLIKYRKTQEIVIYSK